jgi:hypothetical protein
MIQHVVTGSEHVAALDKIHLNFSSQATTLISCHLNSIKICDFSEVTAKKTQN